MATRTDTNTQPNTQEHAHSDGRDGQAGQDGQAKARDDTGSVDVVLADLFELPDRKQIIESPDALTAAVRSSSSRAARSLAEMFAWIDAADRVGMWKTWFDIRSFAHWIAFVCEINAHTAREYTRTIKGLRLMPEVATYFYNGRLSYSKVRAVTRLAGRVDAADAAEFALVTTTGQLELTVATFVDLDDANVTTDDSADDDTAPRIQDSTAADAESLRVTERDQTWLRHEKRDNGRTRLIIELDEADAADVLARIQSRRDALIRAHRDTCAATREGSVSENDVERCLPSRVDAFLDIIHHSAQTHRSTAGEANGGLTDVRSESTMVVHVSTDVLESACARTCTKNCTTTCAASHDAANSGPADIGTDASDGTNFDTPERGAENVSAETPDNPGNAEQPDDFPEQVGYADGYGSIGTATVGRLTCTAAIVGAVIDEGGRPLALGRTKRLASRSQRLALRARDICCQFPGCARTIGIEIHHIRAWADGGPTNVDSMIQLCRAHHVTVHTQHLTIRRAESPYRAAAAGTGMSGQSSGPAFRFYTGNGHEIIAVRAYDDSVRLRVVHTDPVILDIANGARPPVAEGPNRIETVEGGLGFDLEWCVWALFDMQRHSREHHDRLRAQAAADTACPAADCPATAETAAPDAG